MIKVSREVKDLKEDLYIFEIIKGLGVTIRHMFKNVFNLEKLPVIDYPNQEKGIPQGYRGMHRLTQRENGAPRCVACMMCATACPAECIHIEAAESEDKNIEKYPGRFDIDLLECVFCGMCVEACPVDAIRMDSGIYSITKGNRRDFVITKDELLAVKPQREEAKKLNIERPMHDYK
ncbi:MAG: NADH-quinone oxidoreductase subunit I [Candidatus Sericytochromatia bacterium]